jgi:YbbR domain-containing protein
VNRWSVRVIGVLLLLMFLFLFINLKKQLTTIQQRQGTAPSAPATSP